MKTINLKKMFHLLGGIHFAIALITTVTLIVIAGTFIESKTESHRFASQMTYGNPFFSLLLWLFFINIAFAALRRWPFKKKHIPFLITHLGLLMILAGCLVKNYFGIQGSMSLIEGSGSNKIFQAESYAIRVEKRGSDHLAAEYLLNETYKEIFPELSIQLLDFSPHATEHYDFWFKGNQLIIHGLQPFRVQELKSANEELLISGKVRFHPLNPDPVKIIALRTAEVPEALSKISKDPELKPALVFIQDLKRNTYLNAISSQNDTFFSTFKDALPDPILVYSEGYGGYGIQWKLPASFYSNGSLDKEAAVLIDLKKQLREGVEKGTELAPPLKIFQNACWEVGVDFASAFIEYLHYWKKNGHWIFESGNLPKQMDRVLAVLPWINASKKDLQACIWMQSMVKNIEGDLFIYLKRKGWPLASALQNLRTCTGPCRPEEIPVLLEALFRQIYSAAEHLPETSLPSVNEYGGLFSLWLRLYGIHPETIIPDALQSNSNEKQPSLETVLEMPEIILEGPISVRHTPEKPLNKLEENLPRIRLGVSSGIQKEVISLIYDRNGMGLKWPTLNGQYLLRFQPHFQEIPYRLRLRNARQICYPGTSQPYSYECDLIITDKSGTQLERTISMNNVHETWDGFRFYLSGMAPAEEGTIKKVQIIVNHDPGKYYLTYPGAFFLSLGVVLLFWLRPYAK